VAPYVVENRMSLLEMLDKIV